MTITDTSNPSAPHRTANRRNPVVRWFLVCAGIASTALGIIGIFLPLIPTVPLLLLAAACFARSSEKFHQWLLEHDRLGPLIKGYVDGSGIPIRAKITAISMVWVTIPISAFLVIKATWLRVLLIAIAIGITSYLIYLPSRRQ
ncbi:YbaN family protein [Geoanaerobacter pelophilus]|uniref:YbaN family protein n=1 Tax=Geoanaerobacter pelophilus TaxID=60036 RepID=UPI00307CCE45